MFRTQNAFAYPRAEAELAAVIAGLSVIEGSARYRAMEGGLKQPIAEVLKDEILVCTSAGTKASNAIMDVWGKSDA